MGKESTKQGSKDKATEKPQAPSGRLVGVALKFLENGGMRVVRADKGEDGKVTETEISAPRTLAQAAVSIQREAVKCGLAESKRRGKAAVAGSASK